MPKIMWCQTSYNTVMYNLIVQNTKLGPHNHHILSEVIIVQIFFGNKSSSISKAETEKRADPSVEDENDIKKNKMRMKYDVHLPSRIWGVMGH